MPSNEKRDAIALRFLPLVLPIAHSILRRLPRSFELDDLVQLGAIGLLAAAEKFDSSREATFPAYARMRIRGAILDGLGDPQPASLDLEYAANVPGSGQTPEKLATLAQIWASLASLSPRQCAVLTLRCRGDTQRDVARQLGITQSRVHEIEQGGLRALRKVA